jgi:hypothetical protein
MDIREEDLDNLLPDTERCWPEALWRERLLDSLDVGLELRHELLRKASNLNELTRRLGVGAPPANLLPLPVEPPRNIVTFA